jgi:hypothetical protein
MLPEPTPHRVAGKHDAPELESALSRNEKLSTERRHSVVDGDISVPDCRDFSGHESGRSSADYGDIFLSSQYRDLSLDQYL